MSVTPIQSKPWPSDQDTPLAAARKLVDHGCLVVPAHKRHKEPVRGWKRLRLAAEELPKHFEDNPGAGNVGVILGKRSGGLCDVNLETPEAVDVATRLLPATLTFGRESKRRSHWLYVAVGARTTAWRNPTDGALIVELRADGVKNGDLSQTIFPPSIHEESGEAVTFDNGADVEHIHGIALYKLCAELAAASLLREYWASLEPFEIIGALIRAGWEPHRITALLRASDPDGVDYAHQVMSAVERHEKKESLAGWRAVEQRLGDAEIVATICRWLDAAPKAGRGDFSGAAVDDLLTDVMVQGLVVPSGYSLTQDTTLALSSVINPSDEDQDRMTTIATAPVIVSGRLTSTDGRHQLHLSWRANGQWHSLICDRRTAVDAHKILALADNGFPVATHNAKHVCRYLDAFESANRETLPRATSTTQLGWQGRDGADGFLWGMTLIRQGGQEIKADLSDSEPQEWPENAVSFNGNDSGDRQKARAFTAGGTVEGWKDTLLLARKCPNVLAGVFAAWVPPLQMILGVNNFVLDYACTTSHGKTTAMRLAASVWGYPDEMSASGVARKWNATRVDIERLCALSNGLPLFLDDTKTARRREDIESVIYDVAGGRTKGRGSIYGTRPTYGFRTVLISTGEDPLSSYSEAGGTRTRCISLTDPPWGLADETTRPLVEAINRGCHEHYGSAGRLFIQWLLSNQGQWAEFRDMHQLVRKQALELITTGEGARMADYVAAVLTAGWLGLRALGLEQELIEDNPDFANVKRVLCDAVHYQSSDAAPEIRALRWMAGWAVANAAGFYGRHRQTPGGDPIPPGGGWLGRWDSGSDWRWVAVFPHVLNKQLRTEGYGPEAVVGAWARRGWLDKGAGHLTKTIRLSAKESPVRALLVRREAIEQVAGLALDIEE